MLPQRTDEQGQATNRELARRKWQRGLPASWLLEQAQLAEEPLGICPETPFAYGLCLRILE